MNSKAQYLSFILLIFFASSLYTTVPSRAVIAPNQLELIKGSYVDGRLFYSNSTVTNLLVSHPKISVESILEPLDISYKLYEIRYKVDFISGTFNPLGNPYHDFMELTHLVFMHNRTTLFPAAKFATGNSTHYFEASVLEYNTITDMLDFNNTRLTFNSSTYIWKDVTVSHPYYDEFEEIMFIFTILNLLNIKEFYKWTLLGISPSANVSDQINYVNTNLNVDELGDVINKIPIPTSSGPIVNATHVNYDYTSVFGWWDAPEVDAYYEEETGLLIQMVETDGIIKYEFLPTTVHIEKLEPTNDSNGETDTNTGNTFTINNSMLGVALGLATLCVYVILRRKKR
jgi:hypothetical protein